MAPRKDLPRCFACNKNPVDASSFTEWEKRTDEALCATCKTLENPFNKPDDCRLCSLFRRPGPVRGRGKASTKLVFVAEGPGIDEVHPRVMSTLVGGSGRIHDRICALAGTNSFHHYNTNAVKCRPPFNRKPTELELRCCARILVEEIKQHEPNVIVALGDTALYTLTGRTGVAKNRGVPIEGAGKRSDGTPRKVIGTYHPAGIMRQQHLFPMPIWDIAKALDEAAFPEIRRIELRYLRDARAGMVDEDVIRRARIAGVSVEDIETAGPMGGTEGALDFKRGQVVCIGLGHAVPGESACYRWDDRVKQVVTAIHLDPTIEKVGQNCEQFDWDFLYEQGVPEPVGRSFDTMNAEHLVSPDTPKDLATLGANYTDMEHWKKRSDYKEDLFMVCCKDVDGTGRGYLELKKNLKDLGMESLYYDHVMPLQPCLRRMRRAGIKKNIELAIKYKLVLSRKADELEAALREGLGRPSLNVNSPPEMLKLIYEELKDENGDPLQKQYTRGKDGMRLTANADAIDTLVELYPRHKILGAVAQIRTIRNKWIATYIDAPHDDDYVVHPSIGSARAGNGRLNSWKPNAQNVPEEMRVIYQADDDEHVWIEADWGQIEYRLAMILSGDERGLQLMTSGFEIFRATAADVLRRKIDTITDAERKFMKFFIYGLFYGRGAESIALGLGWTISEAEAWMRGIATTYPTFWAWRNNLTKIVDKQNYLKNPFGRRRWWYTRMNMATQALNFPASSTAADMMYEAVIASDRQLPKGATNRLTVHDALDVVAHRSVARETVQCLRDIMRVRQHVVTEASDRPDVVKKYYPDGWWCPSDIHIGRNWLEAKKGNKELEKEILG